MIQNAHVKCGGDEKLRDLLTFTYTSSSQQFMDERDVK